MIVMTPNRNDKNITHIIIVWDKLKEMLLNYLCYFNFRSDNRPFWRLHLPTNN